MTGFELVDSITNILLETDEDEKLDVVSYIMLFFNHWLRLHVYFLKNIDLVDYILETIMSNEYMTDHPKCSVLCDKLQDIKNLDEKIGSGINTSDETVLNAFTILTSNFTEITDQLCICAQVLLCDILPDECMHQSWYNNKIKAEHLIRYTKFVQNLTNWVKCTVLSVDDMDDRAFIIIQFIKISIRSREYHNFCISKCISSGLSDPCIANLAKTWKIANEMEPKLCKIFSDIQDLFQREDNFGRYRAQLKKTDPPAIPFLDAFLKDLVIADETNPDFINYEGNQYFNFDKMASLSEIIRDNLIRYQDDLYLFEKADSIYNFIMNSLESLLLSSNECWDISQSLVEKEVTEYENSNWSLLEPIWRMNGGLDERIQRQKLISNIHHLVQDDIILASVNFKVKIKGGTAKAILKKLVEPGKTNLDITDFICFVRFFVGQYLSPRRTLSILKKTYIRVIEELEQEEKDVVHENIIKFFAVWCSEKPEEYEILEPTITEFWQDTFLNEEIGHLSLYQKFNTFVYDPDNYITPILTEESYYDHYPMTNIFSTNSRIIAEQITLFEMKLLKTIPKRDWITNIKNRYFTSPNIVVLLEYINRSRNWVIDSILIKNTAEERAKRVSFFIEILVELFIIHNFNFSKIIVDSLMSEDIRNLKLTWDIVEKKNWELLESFKKISPQLSSEQNFKIYRSMVGKVKTPFIPFIGLTFKELQYFTVGFDENILVEGRDDIFNFNKYCSLLTIVDELYSAIEKEYDFELDEKIYFFFALNGPQTEPSRTPSLKKKISLKQSKKTNNHQEPNDSKNEKMLFTDEMKTFENIPKSYLKKCAKYNISKKAIQDNIELFWNCLLFMKPPAIEKIYKIEKNRSSRSTLIPTEWTELARELVESDELTQNPKVGKKIFKTMYITGEGGFGCVYCAKNTITKELVALKKISHASEKDQYYNYVEVGLLSHFHHKNIVEFKSASIVGDEMWIAMELMEGGTLEQATKNESFSDNHCAYFAREILFGIQFLHVQQYAHRDLKSANIMLDIKGNIKLIDFGLCAEFALGPRTRMLGSPYWVAPEMIRGEPHSLPVDIWSLGVLMLEVFNHNPPHHRHGGLKCMFEAVTNGLANKIPEDITEDARSFTELCLDPNPSTRATVDDLLEHPWVRRPDIARGIDKRLATIFLKDSLEEIGFF
eukprot:TRINITY_DN3285_c0_g1_i3.p1 TRINITY_DN3285_c0_g1~~TRINITY_DN3285_c0_g1_i3.p1  ORF type:complete len:1173 (+),score=254.74 TRINITY_DN3285_c0_g1_i3:366-3884(+)